MTPGSEVPASKQPAYLDAGVDLTEAQEAVRQIRERVRPTLTPRVQSQIGAFAGFFAYPEASSERLLVSSMDGVGTKTRIASLLGRFRDVGYDIVSHCVNDILVHGATPLFFLDYLGTGKLSASVVAELIEGMCEACVASGCALIGGETAEMPGIYRTGDWEVVGTIVGEVRREHLVDGRGIRAGDRILALRSHGLHTNGYSLARRVLGIEERPAVLSERPGSTHETWGDLLLQRHRLYLPLIRPLLGRGLVQGMAHLTGGGLFENLPRILPPKARAVVRREAWDVPFVFRALCERGGVSEEEAFRVFNMGFGFLLVLRPEHRDEAAQILEAAGEQPIEIGWIEEGAASVRWARVEEPGPR